MFPSADLVVVILGMDVVFGRSFEVMALREDTPREFRRYESKRNVRQGYRLPHRGQRHGRHVPDGSKSERMEKKRPSDKQGACTASSADRTASNTRLPNRPVSRSSLGGDPIQFDMVWRRGRLLLH